MPVCLKKMESSKGKNKHKIKKKYSEFTPPPQKKNGTEFGRHI
jgi:hypothetical protein